MLNNTDRQTTSHLLMIRPVAFDFNAETAVNNAFQQKSLNNNIQQQATLEFDRFVEKLRAHDIDVTVVQDTPVPHTPDSIFPNNWISFHEDGSIVLYPMYAVNRRAERKQHVLDAIGKKFELLNRLDFTHAEAQNRFLEGTGSMVLDRTNRIAYACLSPRTDLALLNEWCKALQYQPCAFYSVDANGNEIYHTNVMMCVADQYAVICLESIPDAGERQQVVDNLTNNGKTIVEISYAQMNAFAGNMLQVQNKKGEHFLIMSSCAYNALNPAQIDLLEHKNRIIHSDLSVIETNGGGSARCMMAEVFLPLKEKS